MGQSWIQIYKLDFCRHHAIVLTSPNIVSIGELMAQELDGIQADFGVEKDEIFDVARAFLRSHPFLSPIPPAPPAANELSAHELSVLAEGGFPEPGPSALRHNIAVLAGEVGVMITSALSQADAAELLGVDQSRIRQRISQGTLFTVSGATGAKVLPKFQFTEEGALPGLEKILPVINAEAHPVSVQRFFITPNADLYSDILESELSPRDWLIAGHSPEPVIRMAADL